MGVVRCIVGWWLAMCTVGSIATSILYSLIISSEGMAAVADLEAALVGSAHFAAKYDILRPLGKGGFGSAYVCRDKLTGQEFACKIVNKAEVFSKFGADATKEVKIMEALSGRHMGVVQLVEAIEDEKDVYVVMELCRGGNLLDVLKANGPMREESARLIIGQLASALAFCHSQRVLHLDIKPENIFFVNNPVSALYPSSSSRPSVYSSIGVRARLADFGTSTILQPRKKVRGDPGSPHFKAPEIVAGDKFGLEVDVWSLGVVLCIALTGAVPFLGTSNHDTAGLNEAILRGDLNFNSARWWNISQEAKDLVRAMLERDPKKRMKSTDILSHPWFSGGEQMLEQQVLPAFAEEMFHQPAPASTAPSLSKTAVWACASCGLREAAIPKTAVLKIPRVAGLRLAPSCARGSVSSKRPLVAPKSAVSGVRAAGGLCIV